LPASSCSRKTARQAADDALCSDVKRELADVRAKLEQLRGELSAARRLDDLATRLEKLEAPRDSTLRAM
jgi:hypothetical protein